MDNFWENHPCPKPELMTAEFIRKVSNTFKLRTTKIDGWHPRQYASLSDEALSALGYIFGLCEHMGLWPTEQSNLLVCLIPKPDGDRRPILHFRSGFRLWSRCAQRRVRDWAASAITDAELNNNAGRAPGDMVWRYAVRASTARKMATT